MAVNSWYNPVVGWVILAHIHDLAGSWRSNRAEKIEKDSGCRKVRG